MTSMTTFSESRQLIVVAPLKLIITCIRELTVLLLSDSPLLRGHPLLSRRLPCATKTRTIPAIKTYNGRRCHEFKCVKKGCRKQPVHRYLDTADASSTSSMHKHAAKCWGPEVLKHAGWKGKEID